MKAETTLGHVLGEHNPRLVRFGFTLVELLVVVAVIVILLALLLPAIGMARAGARAKQCASNQVQVWIAWTNANSKDPRHPVKGSQWTARLAGYIEGSTDIYFCPDDTTKFAPSSYGFNAHAWRFGGAQDAGRIVLLDYKITEALIVGQTLTQLEDWNVQQAPRHFQNQNVTFFDGHGDAYEPRKIDPRYCDYYVRYWRPHADSNIALTGCSNSGDLLPPTPGGAVTSTTSGAVTTMGTSTSGTSSSSTTGGTGADVSIEKNDSVDPVQENGQLTYTITVNNIGPNAATNVVLTDPLPAGVTYVSSSASQGNTVVNGTTITANLGNIPYQSAVTVTIVVVVQAGTGGTQLSNTATVATSSTDPVFINNTSTETTDVTVYNNPCVPPVPSPAAERALNWLIRHQEDPGCWSLKHGLHPGCAGACANDGTVGGDDRVAGTGLALLPLLGAGHVPGTGAPFAENVCRGLEYLISNQDPTTGFLGGSAKGYMYSHLVGSLALVEAVLLKADVENGGGCPPTSSTTGNGGGGNLPPCTLTQQRLRDAAQLAVNFLESTQLHQGGWMYEAGYTGAENPPIGGDMSHHSWAVKVIKGAQLSGLNVPAGVVSGADNFLNAVEVYPLFDPAYNSSLGEYRYYTGLYSPYNSPQRTTNAIGLLSKVFFGAPPKHAKIQAFVAGKVPESGAVYDNFYMTQLLYAMGGNNWNTWKSQMEQLLANSQAVGGHVDGSWFWANSSIDNFGGGNGGWGHQGWNSAGGRLYCTSLSLLCLEQNFSRLKLGGTFGGGTGGGVHAYAGIPISFAAPSTAANLNGQVWGGHSTPTITWSQVNGPGTITFGNSSSAATTVSCSAPGTYTVRLTATDGNTTETSETTVTYQSSNLVQYVRIRTQIATYLTMAEVQVFEGATNIATGGNASQSSNVVNHANFYASKAIDGYPAVGATAPSPYQNLTPSYSCSYTSNSGLQWWVLNLGSPHSISKIVIWNRCDQYGDALSNAVVETFAQDPVANPGQTPTWSTSLGATANCGVYPLNP